MNTLLLLPLVCASPFPPAPATTIDSFFGRLGPTSARVARTPGQHRAVVLIRGLTLRVFHSEKATQAMLAAWQAHDSRVVKQLGRLADVYSFSYAQTVPIEQVPQASGLPTYIGVLRSLGYSEIVVVGYSAGGLVARHLVEDYPDLPITRVIQVCAPNSGCGLAGINASCDAQAPFLRSLSVSGRKACLEGRGNRALPPKLEFVCLVGYCGIALGDFVVTEHSQWSDDLRRQGVPAYRVRTSHADAMRNARVIELLEHIVVTSHPRTRRTD